MDLRLDIEPGKKYSSKNRAHKRRAGRESGDSPGSSRERSTEKPAKHHKKSKKSKKKRERSRSSSTSASSSRLYPGPEAPPSQEAFGKARMPPRDYVVAGEREAREYDGPMERGRAQGGFQFRIRGRGGGRGNCPGNHNNGTPPSMSVPVPPPEEEWDPEYTPKSKKYYLHDDREGDRKWLDNGGRGRGPFPRGRGRFVFRRSSGSPKWTHDKFQGGAEEGELPDDDPDLDQDDHAFTAGVSHAPKQ